MSDKRIKLIVTGDSEKNSFHKSLQKCFPSQMANGDTVIWDTPRKTDGVTNVRIKGGKPSTSMQNLVNAMFAEALESKQPNGIRPDLVIVLDDVELGNLGRESFVVEAFQTAVGAKLAALQETLSEIEFNQTQSRVKSCCSFHLLCPMVESYFFADPVTLTSNGVRAENLPMLVHPTDVEQFDASQDLHPDWQALCQKKNLQQASLNVWWKTERHPKLYLKHLLKISDSPIYHETTLGALMIQAVNWNTVVKTHSDSPIISALLNDIWDWFGLSPQTGHCIGQSSPTTYRIGTAHLPANLLLRNI